jgi:hypothetical protein
MDEVFEWTKEEAATRSETGAKSWRFLSMRENCLAHDEREVLKVSVS